MSSKIESELLIPRSLLALASLELHNKLVILGLTAWETPDQTTKLHFREAKVLSLEQTYDLNDKEISLDFPWDIFGFESDEKLDNKWRFVINTHILELCFESRWPTL